MNQTPRTWAALAAASTLALSTLVPVFAADKPAAANAGKAAAKANKGKNNDKGPVTEESVLKSVKGPAGFDVTVMGIPPQVMYTTAVAATPEGPVFVAIDEQGSLGKEAGRGRVVRVVDKDGDGKGDEFTVVAKMDHPRGLWFDGATSDLYVLHPPFITKYHVGASGVADREEKLVTGISTEQLVQQRGADHTTNGFRVGIDGWMYIAMGDFGAFKATGKDGAVMQYHGGGVARVRLDGTGLEMYSHHQRNICDVAVSPTLEVFTRDNTNDGGGWNVRLSYVIPNAEMGYPSLFKNFNDEIVQPLNDYGGGSPVGAYWLDEPASGAKPGLYTVEWGASKIFYHPLERDGAGYKLKTPQAEWMGVPRATDMDADAAGRIYVTSWANGGFGYSGDNVGFLVRVTPKDFKPASVPDFKKAGDDELVKLLASTSQVTRQAAQRELLTRGAKAPATFANALFGLAQSRDASPAARTAALFTLKQLWGAKAYAGIAELTKDESIRELAIRALGDTKNDSAAPVEPIVAGCADKNPRVRLMAAWALGHLGRKDAADAVVPLVGDADPLVAHTAIHTLGDLQAVDPLLKALDSSNPSLAPGVLRALALIHDVKVVDGLEAKLKTIQDPAVRPLIYRALARLTWTEAEWDGKWWSTRPDTSGPYYKTAEWAGTPKTKAILQAALTGERPEVVKRLLVDLQKNKVDFPELSALLTRMAQQDPSFKPVLLEVLAAKPNLADDQIAMATKFAGADEDPATRALALRLLQKSSKSPAAVDGLAAGLSALIAQPKIEGELRDAFNDITRDTRLAGSIASLAKIADADAAKRPGAYAVLANLASNKLMAKDKRAAEAQKVIDAAWAKDDRAAALLGAIAVTKVDAYNDKVSALTASKNAAVATAAASAAKALGIKGGSAGTPTASAATPGTLIEAMKFEQVLPAVLADKSPDLKRGQELFTKIGCANCHTISTEEKPKGPFLGGVTQRYTRPEMIESILKPSAKIAQGFDTQWFKVEDDDVVDGFVVREAGDEVEIRNAVGETITLKKKEIKERGKRELSMMPPGLFDKYTPHDLASLLAFLDSTKAAAK